MSTDPSDRRKRDIILREPTAEDASAVWNLIRSCEPLDDNSLYCNLLQCDHFAETCVVAERSGDGKIVGWISAYLVPDEDNTLFVWQVAVDPQAQGQGLGKRMLRELVARDACDDVGVVKATITSDNSASWALFSSLARSRGGELSRRPHYSRDVHFDGQHATEHLVTIRLGEKLRVAA